MEVSGDQFCSQLNIMEGLIKEVTFDSLESALLNCNHEFNRLSVALKQDVLK